MITIGLMSGTSLDGVDGVIARFSAGGPASPEVLGHHYRAMPIALRQQLAELNSPGPDELHRAALAANELARQYAAVVQALLHTSGTEARQVAVLGAHGQTVRHRPREFDGCGYTIQLLNGALLAELGGIDVVCDLRSRDVAAGGQGAPLVPAFHAAMWGRPGESLAVLNIGGIANLSLIRSDGAVGGFDCGPGNALMDLWCEQRFGQAYDRDGELAAAGRVDPALLTRLLAEPYFTRRPPKSTGRDLFNAAWLDRMLGDAPSADRSAADVLASLAELTASAAVNALRRDGPPGCRRLLVCGGGALNGHLMRRLSALLPEMEVTPTDRLGLPPLQVEATAFAWLARAHVERRPGNLPQVTGASGPRVLGAYYPAK